MELLFTMVYHWQIMFGGPKNILLVSVVERFSDMFALDTETGVGDDAIMTRSKCWREHQLILYTTCDYL